MLIFILIAKPVSQTKPFDYFDFRAQVVTARIRIRYWFYPFSYVQALLAPVDDLNLRSVQFENQNCKYNNSDKSVLYCIGYY